MSGFIVANTRVSRDLCEGERVGLGRHMVALQFGASLEEAVLDPRFGHVHDVSRDLHSAIVVHLVGLVLKVDASRLVPLVARVVAEARDGDLRDHYLARVMRGAHHAPAAREDARDAGLLVHLVDDRDVVLGECDGI